MESKSCPLIHEVIPVLDLATIYLESMIRDVRNLPVVRTAAARGLVVVDKYYSKTDESLMYQAALSKWFTLY